MKISAEQITAGYHGKAVISGISLAVESGEVLCLLGANGSGKTTLFKTMLGLMRPISGKVCVDG